MPRYYYIHKTPIGRLLLLGQENALREIRFENSWREEDTREYSLNEAIFTKTLNQLNEYFEGKRTTFTISIDPHGTIFQQKVWRELQHIPYGATCSYGEIAKRIDNPKGSRAVGMANGKNPIPIIIPCHRVIGKNGTLTGFGGGLEVKQQLLKIEKTTSSKLEV